MCIESFTTLDGPCNGGYEWAGAKDGGWQMAGWRVIRAGKGPIACEIHMGHEQDGVAGVVRR
jgi:hypothetical protein